MQLSKFAHVFQTGNDFAYYNSLFLKPVYLNAIEHSKLQQMSSELDDELRAELSTNKIIIEDEATDEELLRAAREQLLVPYPTIMYLILSEKCNLACRYCFLGNGDRDIVYRQMPKMSRQIADKALDYFIRQLDTHSEWGHESKEIIFYGGEPLLNFEVLKHVVERGETLDADWHYAMVTNGLLLTSEIIDFLKAHNVNVSISIDGVDRISNSARVDKGGLPIFERLLENLILCRDKNFPVGLSITLTEETLESVDKIIRLSEEYDIAGISFNILYAVPNYEVQSNYYRRAAKFIIDFYKTARQCGIYEDRIMRKLNAFIEGRLYLSDCAATSGSQIVVLPNGRVGICQGCLENKEYFFTDVDDRTLLENNAVMLEWSKISPINKDECLSCEALGICGGGWQTML